MAYFFFFPDDFGLRSPVVQKTKKMAQKVPSYLPFYRSTRPLLEPVEYNGAANDQAVKQCFGVMESSHGATLHFPVQRCTFLGPTFRDPSDGLRAPLR